MSEQVQLPRKDRTIVFPDKCACCGAAKVTESRMVLNRLVARGQRQESVDLKLEIPHCGRCARGTKAVFLAGCIPFVLGLLLLGLITFGLVTFQGWKWGLDEMGKNGNANSLVLGAAAGLGVGLVGGFLFEVIARVLLLPVMGRALFDAPLLAIQFLKDSDYVAGVSGKLSKDGDEVHLTFNNPAVAREFRMLNEV